MSLSDTFAGESEAARKKAFKRNKDLATAQALILTYESAIAAYRSQLTATPDSPIRAAIAAGIAPITEVPPGEGAEVFLRLWVSDPMSALSYQKRRA